MQATESKSKQCLQHLIPCQPSKPRVSPALRGVINNLEVGQHGGVLLQSLQLSLFSASHTFFFFWVTGEMSIPLWQAAFKDARRT